MVKRISKNKVKTPKKVEKLVCLNVGCGDKIIRSDERAIWINVDNVKDPRPNFFPALKEGEKPDAQFKLSDVRTLEGFEPNSVDQIHAYHVIEHFPVYEIEAILIRWLEVLKPGGLLVLEQPDLVKSCINFLQIVTSKDQTMVNNLGLYGFFGKPTPENKGMEHKWGWIPDTLNQVVQNAGFVEISNPPPRTHMQAKRDFRVEAIKPFSE